MGSLGGVLGGALGGLIGSVTDLLSSVTNNLTGVGTPYTVTITKGATPTLVTFPAQFANIAAVTIAAQGNGSVRSFDSAGLLPQQHCQAATMASALRIWRSFEPASAAAMRPAAAFDSVSSVSLMVLLCASLFAGGQPAGPVI